MLVFTLNPQCLSLNWSILKMAKPLSCLMNKLSLSLLWRTSFSELNIAIFSHKSKENTWYFLLKWAFGHVFFSSVGKMIFHLKCSLVYKISRHKKLGHISLSMRIKCHRCYCDLSKIFQGMSDKSFILLFKPTIKGEV